MFVRLFAHLFVKVSRPEDSKRTFSKRKTVLIAKDLTKMYSGCTSLLSKRTVGYLTELLLVCTIQP